MDGLNGEQADQAKEKCNPGGIIRQRVRRKKMGRKAEPEKKAPKRKKAIEREKGRIGNVTTFAVENDDEGRT